MFQQGSSDHLTWTQIPIISLGPLMLPELMRTSQVKAGIRQRSPALLIIITDLLIFCENTDELK